MLAVSSLRSATLVMADASIRNSGGGKPAATAAQAIIQAANGRSTRSAAAAPKPAEERSAFSSTRIDLRKMKAQMMERVGQAFGFELKDFDDVRSLGEAVRSALSFLDERGVAAMEKELGLDHLGVSLRDVVDAMKDPGGAGDDRLEAALLEDMGLDMGDRRGTARIDEIGRYSQA